MPAVKRGDISSLRQLINHVSRHTEALQALTLNVTFQDLVLNHMMLAILDADTHREWELLIASR
jgi:predicted metalloenzyme YecM